MLRFVTPMLILVVVSAVAIGAAAAQEAVALAYGETVTGMIDDVTPENVYRFSVQAGGTAAIAITATSGDLDTLLILTDESGAVLTQDDDSGGGRNSLINYTFDAAGAYFVIATRYDRASGTTSGAYTLTLTAVGDEGATPGNEPPLEGEAEDEFGMLPDLGGFSFELIGYGEAAAGTIDDEQTAQAFAFPGRAGETVTVRVQRTDGDLALMVALFDRTGTEALVEAEDVENAGMVQYRHILPGTAYYVVAVGRMEPAGGIATAGAFELQVDVEVTAEATEELAVSTPTQAPAPQPTPEPTEPSSVEVTLRWNTIADLDLVLYYPAAEGNAASIDWQHIAYSTEFVLPEGATFETDGNGFCQNLTTAPVERITWVGDGAPAGAYEVLVWYQFSCGSAETSVPFELTITVGDETQTLTGAVDAPKGEYRTTFVRP